MTSNYPFTIRRSTITVGCACALLLAGCSGGSSDSGTPGTTVTTAEVVKTDAQIAFAAYSDAITTAQAMQTALQALVDTPSEATLTAAPNHASMPGRWAKR